MTVPTIPKRYLLVTKSIARKVPAILEGNGLEPAIDDWVLTNNAGRVWLFAAVDVDQVSQTQRRYTKWYTDPDLLHDIGTALDGIPVYTSNSNGLRYAFLLSQRPRLPRRADFPGCVRGVFRLGVGPTGQPVSIKWDDLGHLLVAGMTRSGKSNLLRLLVYQGLREGAAFLLGDLDGVTFPMLEGSPTLLAPVAAAPGEVHDLVKRAIGECDRRQFLYRSAGGHPETLAEYNAQATRGSGCPLPRVLVILDEFNATALALGGARGGFAGDVASLCWRGLKFGVHVVVAAQDFDKRIVGRMRDQVNAVCFRVKSPELARAVGCAGAHGIPENRPGQAVAGRWGMVQTYYLDKSLLTGGDPAPVIDDQERALVEWALGEGRGDDRGYLSIADVQDQLDLSPWQARKKAEEWEGKGWLAKDPGAANKRKLTPDFLRAFRHKPQTPQPPSNLDLGTQGALKPPHRPQPW